MGGFLWNVSRLRLERDVQPWWVKPSVGESCMCVCVCVCLSVPDAAGGSGSWIAEVQRVSVCGYHQTDGSVAALRQRLEKDAFDPRLQAKAKLGLWGRW